MSIDLSKNPRDPYYSSISPISIGLIIHVSLSILSIIYYLKSLMKVMFIETNSISLISI